jgi:hypothetical protein
MPDLEDQLSSLASVLDWPATPDLRRRLSLPAVRERPVGRWPALRTVWGASGRGRWALAAAAVLLILATVLAYTPTRDAIAGWLSVHTVFHRTEQAPTPSPLPPGPLGARFQLGAQTTLAGAQQQVSWHIVVPTSLGAPDEVYVKPPPTGPSGGEVTLVYGARPNIHVSGLTGVSVLVTEARGRVNEAFFSKTLGPDVAMEQVTVNGRLGYWISGRPHSFAFTDAAGNVYFDTLRLATNTLVFDDGGTVVRIEGDLSKEQAITIGRSIS